MKIYDKIIEITYRFFSITETTTLKEDQDTYNGCMLHCYKYLHLHLYQYYWRIS